MKRTEILKQTQRQLLARRDALRRTLAGDMGVLRSQSEGSLGDEIDQAIASEQAELRSQMASFESRELAQIESALAKIHGGRYGRCDVCDKPIAPMRLKALPYATECIACARSGERRAPAEPGFAPVNRIAGLASDDSEVSAGETADEAYEEIG